MSSPSIRKFVNPIWSYKTLSASGLVKTGFGICSGIFISAIGTLPTITVYDNTTATNPVIIATFTPTAGMNINWPNLAFDTGLYVAIGGTGTTNITVFYV